MPPHLGVAELAPDIFSRRLEASLTSSEGETMRKPMLDFEEGDLVTARQGAALMHVGVKRFYALYRHLAIRLRRRRLLWDRRELLRVLNRGRQR